MKVENLPTSLTKPVEVLVVLLSINTHATLNTPKVFIWAIVGSRPLMLKASGIVNHIMVMITLFNIHSALVCHIQPSIGNSSALINSPVAQLKPMKNSLYKLKSQILANTKVKTLFKFTSPLHILQVVLKNHSVN